MPSIYERIQNDARDRDGLIALRLSATTEWDLTVEATFGDGSESYFVGHIDAPNIHRRIPAVLTDSLDELLEEREWQARNAAVEADEREYHYQISRGTL